uniref:Uncharacterized protein n=1 Tax=Rhizophagus irregularis (strain DAOM 181602 / DAOM 197198 / MUCL 43194) TaxID=747089 RepID=U9UUR0_RHIID
MLSPRKISDNIPMIVPTTNQIDKQINVDECVNRYAPLRLSVRAQLLNLQAFFPIPPGYDKEKDIVIFGVKTQKEFEKLLKQFLLKERINKMILKKKRNIEEEREQLKDRTIQVVRFPLEVDNCKNPNKLSNYAEAVKGGQQHLRKGFNKDFRPWIKCHVIKESENPNKLSNYAEAVKGGQQHLRKGFNTDFRPWIKCHVIKESEVVLKKDQDILTEDKY